MAIWRVCLDGLKPVLDGNNIFPILEIEKICLEFEQNFVVDLDQQAKEISFEKYQEFCDFLVTSIDRIDKKTKKKYDRYIDFRNPIGVPKSILFYNLNKDQKETLLFIKQNIYSRFVNEFNKGEHTFTGTHYDLLFKDTAYLHDYHGKILTHAEINETLRKIKRFYSKITDTEIIILGAHKEKINELLKQSPNLSVNLLKTLLEWIAKNEDNRQIINKLESIKIDDINKINLIIGISSLRNILDIWEKNSNESKEEYWQNILQDNSIILSQLFSYPIVLTKGKAYVGGKDIFNTNGNIVDFLLSNKLTKSSILVEIKTPNTKLIGSKYREGIFNVSQELTGAIIQASIYKDSLLKEFNNLGKKIDFEVFNPLCLVIAGNFQNENMDNEQRRSFEIFRSGLKDVQIITYDELFEKIRILLNLLELSILHTLTTNY